MGKFQQNLNIANFICKFGHDKVLLDLAHDVVIPAFFGGFQRSYKDTKYFLTDTSLVDLSDKTRNELALVGRFVKVGKVGRDQVYEGGKIVKDKRELDTAPTSLFVLLLSNHKLLYVRETPGAPSIETFATTIESFIKVQLKNWINEEYERLKEAEKKVTKKQLYEIYPVPEVNIVELSSEFTINQFVKKFSVLNSVEIRLVDTNHEIDNSPLFDRLRNVKNNLGADSLTVKNEKKGLFGLKKDYAAKLVAGPAEEGNSRITLRGLDSEGDKLQGNNDEFKLSVPIELPSRVQMASAKMIDVYNKTLGAGLITIKEASKASMNKLLQLKTQLDL
jgi:hypothetical protein